MLKFTLLLVALFQCPQTLPTAKTVILNPPLIVGSAGIARHALIVVTAHGDEVAIIECTGEIRIDPAIGSVCDVARFRRNLVAASKGSKKAARYLHHCVRQIKQP
jgi:hypothetical protein